MTHRVAFLIGVGLSWSAGTADAQSRPDSVARLNDVLALARADGLVKIRHFLSTKGSVPPTTDAVVLADCDGPGVVTAFAVAPLTGRVRVTLDGSAPAVIDAPAADFFGGKVQPFVDPIVTVAGGGGFSAWPIAFQRSLRIEWSGVEHPALAAWEVQVEERPGETLKTFSPRLTQAEREARDQVVLAWMMPGRSPAGAARTDVALRENVKLGPKETKPFLLQQGAGVLLTLRIDPFYTSEGPMRALLLEVFVDGALEPSVSAPIGDLSGASYGVVNARGVLLGADQVGTTFQLPMPFGNGLRATLTNRLNEKVEALTVGIVRPLDVAPPWRFHAEMATVAVAAGAPHVFADLDGPGRFVGLSYAAQGVADLRCLEGAVRIASDGQAPVTWARHEPFLACAAPLRGPPFAHALFGLGLREEAPGFRVTAWRARIADALPFTSHFHGEFELGAANGVTGGETRTVAFWYGPLRSVRRLRPADDVLSRRFVLRGEGDAPAAALAWTGPVDVQRKPWEEVSDAFRSTGARFRSTAEGSGLVPSDPASDGRVVLFPTDTAARTFATRLKAPAPGRYELMLVLTSALKGPEVEVRLGETRLGSVSTRGSVPAPGSPSRLGPIEVSDDALELRLTVGAAPPGTVVGIDSYRFVRLP